MATNNITIDIEVNAKEATSTLKQVDRAIADLGDTANGTSKAVSFYDEDIQNLIKSKKDLSVTTSAAADSLIATREAVHLNSVAVQDLFQWVDQGGKGWRDYAADAKAAFDVLKNVKFSDIWQGINGIADAAGLSITNLGLMGSAGLALGAGWAGWGVGRAIAGFFDLDKKIGNATASLIGFGDVAGQTAAAKADILAKASATVGKKILDINEAMDINARAAKNMTDAWVEMGDITARKNAPQKLYEDLYALEQEIKKVAGAGVLGDLKDAINSHIYSTKQLSDAYKISEAAVNLFKQQLEKEAAANKAATAEHEKRAAAAQKAADQEAAAWEKLQDKVEKIEQGYYGVTSAIKQLGFIYQPIAADVIKETNDVYNAVKKLETGIVGPTKAMETLGIKSKPTMHDLDKGTDKATISLRQLSSEFVKLAQIGGGTFGDLERGIGSFITSMDMMHKAGGDSLSQLKDLKKGWDDLSKSAKVAAGVLAGLAVASAATDPDTKSGAVLSAASKGAQIGSIAGPYGTLIGAGIGALVGAFSDLEKKVNPVRQAFVDMNGGLAELDKKAHDAGMTLTALLNAKNPEAYTKAINDLNAAIKFQDDAMKTLDDTVKKYGFTIDELGPAFAAQKLSEQAGQLLQDYQVLTAAGVDHVAIINKMGPALQDYVSMSLKAGIAIPEQMKPVLQSMVDLGLLTDENGDKLTDLTKLTFAETLDKKFSDLIDTINKLTDAISRGLGTAIQNIPSPNAIHVPVVYDYPPEANSPNDNYAASGGLATNAGVQYLARGGNVLSFRPRGTDTVPAMLTPGEGVVTRSGMKRLGRSGLSALNSGSGGGGGMVINVGDIQVGSNVSDGQMDEQIGKAIGRVIRRRGKRIA